MENGTYIINSVCLAFAPNVNNDPPNWVLWWKQLAISFGIISSPFFLCFSNFSQFYLV